MTAPFANSEEVMRRALEIARRGIGFVEPNPAVGAVLVDGDLRLIAEGWHERFGGPHAEAAALDRAGAAARGATLYVSLEPCCHFGKTPPCVDAIVAAGIRRVVVAQTDPYPEVAGNGIRKLQLAGIEVSEGLLQAEAKRLNAPFLKLIEQQIPYVHAKWAMTLDGKIASKTGASKWITNELSRAKVHEIRGRMDAIVVGLKTALADDPLLTARPVGPRIATRVVFDSLAQLPLESQLIRTVQAAPVLLAVGPKAPSDRVDQIRDAGVEVVSLLPAPGSTQRPDPWELLKELGRRRMTNILVEGGGELLGQFLDRELADELHVFIAPKILGGRNAISPVLGDGREVPSTFPDLDHPEVEVLSGDVYLHGMLRRRGPAN